MTGGTHYGDNFTMTGNNNVNKVARGTELPNPWEPTRSSPVWSEPLVFINYRSADDRAATDLEEELNRQLGAGAVFRDVRIPAGTDFPRELTHRAGNCAVMLSIIGEKWDDDHGLRLLNNHSDWVRHEIATALAHRVQVIPVLVGARGRLVPSDLPEDIRALAYLQGLHLRRLYTAAELRGLVEELLRDLPVLAQALLRGR
jgi:hypothetical protein